MHSLYVIQGGDLFTDLNEFKEMFCQCMYVNQKLLLTKLHYFGIKWSMANWFKSYLKDRK
jgi:hypothetical protein